MTHSFPTLRSSDLYWIRAFVLLWPAPGIAEGVLVLGALAAIIKLLMTRFRGGTELLSGPAWALTSALFFAYWLPQLLSSFDAIDAREAFYKSATALRYLPFLWLVASAVADRRGRRITFGRSEEHTSELQSLMRISYAVFCLKK